MASALKIGVALGGFDEIKALLAVLPERTQNKVIGVALEAAGRPIVSAAKRLAPKRTGALRASITQVLRRYGAKAVLVIGPDKNYYEAGKKVKKGAARSGQDRPANYAHLVEFGFRTRNSEANAKARKFVAWTGRERAAAAQAGRALPQAGRRTVDFVAPQPFLRPAVQQQQGAAARAFEDGVVKGLVRETNKINRKLIKQAGQAA